MNLAQPEQPGSSAAHAAGGSASPARLANRFDIRRLIGGVFLLYGAILTALGVFGSTSTKHKAAGIDIDLWTGLGMLAFGALMLGWALWRPTIAEPDS